MVPGESPSRARRVDTNKTGDLEAPARVTGGKAAGGEEADPAGSLSPLMSNTGIWKFFGATVRGERSRTGDVTGSLTGWKGR